VQVSVKHVEPCTGASITKSATDTASLTTSDPVAAQADTLQYDLNKGPCLRLGQTRPQLPALRRGQRYPLATLLQGPARAHPYRSVLWASPSNVKTSPQRRGDEQVPEV
jgi:hypothetical protein